MAGRTSENKWARRWGPHEPQQGSRRTNRSQHVGPFLLLRANMGLLLARGATVAVGAPLGPQRCTHARTDGGRRTCICIFCRLAYGSSVYPAQPKSCTVHHNSHARTSNLSFFFPCIFALVLRNSQGRPNIWNFVY